jgi:hypothetical protein
MWLPAKGSGDLGDGGALGPLQHGDQPSLLAVRADAGPHSLQAFFEFRGGMSVTYPDLRQCRRIIVQICMPPRRTFPLWLIYEHIHFKA